MLVVGEMETPTPGAGEVLVRLAVSGVNPSDVKSRAGRPLTAPRIIPHSDGAGIIEAVGAGVDRARIGERALDMERTVGSGPSARPPSLSPCPSNRRCGLPDNVDFAAGACLGIPALTALQAVEPSGRHRGQDAAGHRRRGPLSATTSARSPPNRARASIATASARRAEHARAAGASEIIDYTSEDIAERVRELTGGKGVDGIIDMDLSTTAPLPCPRAC